MKKNFIALVVLLSVGFTTYYFVFKDSIKGTTTPTPQSSEVTINIKGLSFDSSNITISPGQKVTWTNNDTVQHTITSDSGNLLNSPTLSPGQSFSFIFKTIESIKYHCTIHPMMKGEIIVAGL